MSVTYLQNKYGISTWQMTLFDFPGRVWFDCGNFVHQYCTVFVLVFGLFITLQKKYVVGRQLMQMKAINYMTLWTEYLTQTITPLEGRGTLLLPEPRVYWRWLDYRILHFVKQVVFHKTPKYTIKIQPISSNSIVENSFGNGGQRVVSSVETCRIVGR